MGGYPRWIRRDRASNYEYKPRLARAWALVEQYERQRAAALAASTPQLKPSGEACVALPNERQYPAGSLGARARVSRVGGTGGEHDTRR